MDNFTHSLAGWALGQAGLKTKSRKGLAALILGANAPDIDVFFGRAPWAPLAMHRGFTHGLVGGVLILPLLLTGLLIALDRWQVKRSEAFRSGLALHPGWLLALAYLGTLTHPFLDLLTTYSVQLFAPLTRDWWHADALFIIDAVLWTAVPLGIALSRRREQAGRADWRRPAQAALAFALAYIGLNLGLTQVATAAVRAAHPRAQTIFASPPPVLFWRREMAWVNGAAYHGANWSPLAGLTDATAPVATGLDDPRLRPSLAAAPQLTKFLGWSVMPLVRISDKGCTRHVMIGDFRYNHVATAKGLSRTADLPIAGCKEPATR